MSLVSLINKNKSFQAILKANMPSKEYFTTNTPHPPFSGKNPLLVPYALENSHQSCILGIASDYMFRFIIAKTIYNNKNAVLENLTAEKGVDLITKRYYNKYNLAKDDESTLDKKLAIEKLNNDFLECKNTMERYINGEDSLSEQVIHISIWFAQLEDVFRNGLEESINIAISKRGEPLIEKELCQLCHVFTKTFIETNIIAPNSDVVFNPTFGEWSEKFGGADADIYIDGTIYDFKSTKKVYCNWEYVAQVFSYFALYLLDRQNKRNGTLADKEVKNVALYYSRYGLINTCNISFSDAKYDDTFLQDFARIAQDCEENSQAYIDFAERFNGYKPIFPQFSKNFIDREKFGAISIDDYISHAFPSFSLFDTAFLKGHPIFWSGNYFPDIIEQKNCFYVIRIKACFNIKSGKQPFVQSKIGFLYPKNKILSTSDLYNKGKYYRYYKDFDGNAVKARPILTLTKDDYHLFFKNYDVSDVEILDGCYFN